MGDAQGGESALELGVGVEPVGGGGVTEEGQAVGVKAGGRAEGFQEWTEVGEVGPGGVTRHEEAAEDFAGVVIEGQDECGVMVGGPPGMGRGVVLPKFAGGRALPAAPRLGAAFERGHALRKMLAHVSGDGGRGTDEVELAGQLIGQEREVERSAVRQDARQELLGGRGPGGFVVAAGGLGGEGGLVA